MSDSVTLLPPNATELERALARCAARVSSLGVTAKMLALWNPETCPAATLPWLAQALHVDEWSETWTEAQKRAVIAASVATHKRKGTIGALKRALAALGYEVVVDEDTGIPFTFRLAFNLNQTGPLTGETYAAARRVALANKNARSHLLAVRSTLTGEAGLHIGVAHYRAQTVTADAGKYDLPPDAHTLLQVQVDAAGNIVERTGKTITTIGTVIVDHTTTRDGFGSIVTATDSYLEVDLGASYDHPLTIEAWINPTSDATGANYIQGYHTTDVSSRDWSIMSGQNGNLYFLIWHLYSGPVFSNNFNNEWGHVASVLSPSGTQLYSNGITAGSDVARPSSTRKVRIGMAGCRFENIRVSNIARYTMNFTPKGRF